MGGRGNSSGMSRGKSSSNPMAEITVPDDKDIKWSNFVRSTHSVFDLHAGGSIVYRLDLGSFGRASVSKVFGGGGWTGSFFGNVNLPGDRSERWFYDNFETLDEARSAVLSFTKRAANKYRNLK